MIADNGDKLGEMSVPEALRIAQEAAKDLVEISPNTNPPVCRIMDHGKHLFEQKKKKAQQKSKQVTTQTKEIKFRPTTDVGDYNIKRKKIIKFLEAGNKVKVTIRFRGREMQHRDLGITLLNRLHGDVIDVAEIEQQPKIEGRQIGMVLVPAKVKKSN